MQTSETHQSIHQITTNEEPTSAISSKILQNPPLSKQRAGVHTSNSTNPRSWLHYQLHPNSNRSNKIITSLQVTLVARWEASAVHVVARSASVLASICSSKRLGIVPLTPSISSQLGDDQSPQMQAQSLKASPSLLLLHRMQALNCITLYIMMLWVCFKFSCNVLIHSLSLIHMLSGDLIIDALSRESIFEPPWMQLQRRISSSLHSDIAPISVPICRFVHN